jgi:hypothetical protein
MLYIVSTVEPIPFIDGDVEPWRSQSLAIKAKSLEKNVVFFISSFNHYNKAFRRKSDIIEYKERYGIDLKFIPSIGYKRNISIRRIANYLLQATYLFFYFLFLSRRKDALLLTIPAIEHVICLFTFRGRTTIDYRDLWPDIFISENRGLKSLLLSVYFYSCRVLLSFGFSKCLRIVTISTEFKKHLCESYSCVAPDKVFVLTQNRFSNGIACKFHIGSKLNKLHANYVYAGKISERTGVTDFIAKLLNHPVFSGTIHICGSGDDLAVERLKCLISDYPHAIYHGLLDKEKLNEIYLNSDIGIIPYPNHVDFRMALPNKFFEYLSVGLRIGHSGLYSITNNALIDESALAFNVFTDELQPPSISPYHLLGKFNENYENAQNSVLRYL